LDALAVAIHTRKVNWVLEADIRAFFDTLDHGWRVKFVEHRIGDRRLVRPPTIFTCSRLSIIAGRTPDRSRRGAWFGPAAACPTFLCQTFPQPQIGNGLGADPASRCHCM
jgi:hypothetical protein